MTKRQYVSDCYVQDGAERAGIRTYGDGSTRTVEYFDVPAAYAPFGTVKVVTYVFV